MFEFITWCKWYLDSDIIEIRKNEYLYDAPVITCEDIARNEWKREELIHWYTVATGVYLYPSLMKCVTSNLFALIKRLRRSPLVTSAEEKTDKRAGSKVNSLSPELRDRSPIRNETDSDSDVISATDSD